MASERARVLVLQQHASERNTMAELVRGLGYEPIALYDVVQAFSALAEHEMRAVIVSEDLGGSVEIPKLLATLARFHPAMKRVVLSDGNDLTAKLRYRAAPPHAILAPANTRKDLEALHRSLEQVLK